LGSVRNVETDRSLRESPNQSLEERIVKSVGRSQGHGKLRTVTSKIDLCATYLANLCFLRLQRVGWYHSNGMAFPIKVCTVCSEEFELKPDKPGFANRCPECSEPEQVDSATKQSVDADERKSLREANEARRQAMRDLLYRKDS
jgi:hypothetical protein